MFAILGLLKNEVVWAIFPAIGGIIGMHFSVALLSDGSLTFVSGGTTTAMASASLTATSAWQFLSLLPPLLTITAFLVAIYKVGKAF